MGDGTRRSHPVVHLELHTRDLAGACAFYAELCGWSTERIETECGHVRSLDPGGEISGGVVECETAPADVASLRRGR